LNYGTRFLHRKQSLKHHKAFLGVREILPTEKIAYISTVQKPHMALGNSIYHFRFSGRMAVPLPDFLFPV